MHAKVILANPEKALYAAHIADTGKISVFELTQGKPLKTGDILRGCLGEVGCRPAIKAGDDEELVIIVIKTGISPVAAHFCLQGLEE